VSTNLKVISIVIIAFCSCLGSIILGEYFLGLESKSNLTIHTIDKTAELLVEIKPLVNDFIRNGSDENWSRINATMSSVRTNLSSILPHAGSRRNDILALTDHLDQYGKILERLHEPAARLGAEKKKLQEIGLSFSKELEDSIINPFKEEESMRTYAGKAIDPFKSRVKDEAYDLLSLHLKQQILLLEFALSMDSDTYTREKKEIFEAIQRSEAHIRYMSVLLGNDPSFQSVLDSLQPKIPVLLAIGQNIIDYFNSLLKVNEDLDAATAELIKDRETLLSGISTDIETSNRVNRISNAVFMLGILIVLGFFGYFLGRDVIRFIRNSKIAQAKIEESEKRFRTLTEQGADALFLIDFGCSILEVNQRACEGLGYTREELLSMNIGDIDQAFSDRNECDSVFGSLSPGIPQTIESTHRRKDGSIFPVETRIGLIDFGGRSSIIGISRDITARKQAEEALQLSRENLRITLNSIGDGVIATDTNGCVTGINPVAERLMGLESGKAIGMKLSDIFHIVDSDSRNPVDDPVNRVLRNNSIVEFANNTTLVSADGKEYFIADSGAPIRNENGEIFGVVLIFRDVTEKNKMEERLRQSQKMDAIGQLAGGVAHDFNNMLSGIMGAAELISLFSIDNDKIQSGVSIIREAASRAADLTAKLLSFSRKAKVLELTFKAHECIENALLILERSIDKRIGIRRRFWAKQDSVNGDMTQLQNAILNLGINARDAMPDGGLLTVSTENVYFDEIYCNLSTFDLKPGYYIKISIEDTGIGMDKAILSRLFEPFFTTKAMGKGTGLGLASVYGTTKEHKGEIHAYSEPGKGSVFTMSLPIVDAPALKEKPDEAVAIHGNGSILIVEDEEVIRDSLTIFLTQIGYRIFTAPDGFEAIEAFRNNHEGIDIVLLDLIMPRMGGEETFYELRAIDPGIKVIISSGFARDTNAMKLLEDGAVAFIQKPYKIMEVVKIINEALRR
jgi:PAS domain S-box-containing protein